jgi:hypothetical protein
LSNEKKAAEPQAWEDPMSMVVSTAPNPAEVLADQANRTRRGRLWMVMVWLVCAAPVIASYLTFYVFRPSTMKSYGELIEPQRDLPALTAHDLQGQARPLQALKGQWLLLSVSGGACDEGCQKRLYLQRQLRETMGKDKDRMDWVWLIDDQADVPKAMLPALHDAQVWRVNPQDLRAWLSPAAQQQLSDHLYVIDPMGRWMMRFPASLDLSSAAKAKKDLSRLLTASGSWDKAGRE